MFVNYAHRGASAYAPENTMSAFNKALKTNCNGIELDLRKTKDNKIVIFHNKKIDNKSNSTGLIEDYTYKELLNFDFGSWFSPEYENEKIVLFEDFVKSFLSKKMIFAIELKVTGIEEEVLKIIYKYTNGENVYITSFHYEILKKIREIDKNVKLSWLIKEKINANNVSELLKIQGNQICPEAKLVTKEDIKFANENNLGVRLWGIYNEEIMREAYKLNIEGMTVDFPDKLDKLIKSNI